MEARTKKIFKFVFVTLFVDLLAFTLILPLLPKILDYYATNDKSGAYKLFEANIKMLQNFIGVPQSHNQVLLAGALGSWFSLLQFVSLPVLGGLSDLFGRKPILLMAMSGTVVSYAIWLISSENFTLFVLSRTVGGLCKANVGISLAIISDVSDDNSRGKGMAVVGSSFSLAFILGPLLGAYLSTLAKGDQMHIQLIINPSLIATLLSLVDLALVMLLLDETNSTKRIKKEKANERVLTKAFHYVNPSSLFNFKLVKQKTKEDEIILTRAGLVYFYYLLFYSGLEFTLSFLTHIRFGFSSVEQGKLYLFSGILMALIQGGYIRRMKSGKEALMSTIGLTIIIPSFILMGISTSVKQIYFSLALYAISSAVVVPCLTTVVSSQCPPNSIGVVMGTFRSIGALARAIGPCLASLLFWSFGPTICYIGCSVALLLPLYLMKDLYLILKYKRTNVIVPKYMSSQNHIEDLEYSNRSYQKR